MGNEFIGDVTLTPPVKHSNITNRIWGYYEIIDQGISSNTGFVWKLKKLVVFPGRTLSFQQHEHRTEFWTVVEGWGMLVFYTPEHDHDATYLHVNDINARFLQVGSTMHINTKMWHQLTNPSDKDLVIIEMQTGKKCEEEDIVRM